MKNSYIAPPLYNNKSDLSLFIPCTILNYFESYMLNGKRILKKKSRPKESEYIAHFQKKAPNTHIGYSALLCLYLLFPSAGNDRIVGSGSNAVNDHIQNRKDQETGNRCADQQSRVCETEQRDRSVDQRKIECKVDSRHDQRRKKDGEHL